ncbi:nickel-dependent lactate racemase [Alicyclobacillus tolerans]|uniref:lactate racemase domain-containing protein n=1 Tax=Alicyclobacillus tolerans TaxID=90970 RepID=UPI001F24F22B|nr:lactate racemase domain-containing protein [Alicyclobacillus tolerans]MCF8563820.1 nickel-dependent lactate racemase [Alicyclobacillus tolerans]
MFEHSGILSGKGCDFYFPKLVPIWQTFEHSNKINISAAIRSEFGKREVQSKIKPNMNVAVAVGSRGIANLKVIVRSVVTEIQKLGARAFIIPAMGSHGGASAEGQMNILASYGITEEQVGASVRSSMDTVVVGHLDNGLPIHFDKHAFESDAVIVVNRIKSHTGFNGQIEAVYKK